MTSKERALQKKVLQKYRNGKLYPTIVETSNLTGVSTSTVNLFVGGASDHAELRAFFRNGAKANYKSLPPDLTELFAAWDQTS